MRAALAVGIVTLAKNAPFSVELDPTSTALDDCVSLFAPCTRAAALSIKMRQRDNAWRASRLVAAFLLVSACLMPCLRRCAARPDKDARRRARLRRPGWTLRAARR